MKLSRRTLLQASAVALGLPFVAKPYLPDVIPASVKLYWDDEQWRNSVHSAVDIITKIGVWDLQTNLKQKGLSERELKNGLISLFVYGNVLICQREGRFSGIWSPLPGTSFPDYTIDPDKEPSRYLKENGYRDDVTITRLTYQSPAQNQHQLGWSYPSRMPRQARFASVNLCRQFYEVAYNQLFVFSNCES